MPLSLPQQTIASSTARFRCIVAGRRFGKTHLAIRELARFARFPNQTVWYLTNSRQQAKSLVWNKLKTRLRQLNWIKNTNESELTITLVNGSTISLKSAEQGDNLRGASLSFIVMDEFCDIAEEVWTQICRPALSDQKGHAMFIGTPKAGAQWCRDLYDNYLTKPNWQSFSYTTEQGGFVDEEELEQARRDLSPKVYAQEYLASWVNLSNLVFEDFGDHNVEEVRRPGDHEPLIVGLDFNINPLCAQVGRLTRDGLEFFDEIILQDSNTNEFCEELRSRYPKNPFTIYPDPAGVQRKTSANGNTDIKILENAGFTTRYHRQHPLIRDRINAANSLFFQREDGSTRFKIDPRCQFTIKSMRNWTYKEGTTLVDKTNGWDHACDSISYPIEFLFPIKREREQTRPQSWGHRLAR